MVKLYVPKAFHSTIAGNSGNNVKHIRATFGVTVDIPRLELASTEITIEGDRAAEAIAFIEERLGFTLSRTALVEVTVNVDATEAKKLFTGTQAADDGKAYGVGLRIPARAGDNLIVQGPRDSINKALAAWGTRLGKTVSEKAQPTSYEHKVDIQSSKIAECIFFGDGDKDDEHDLDRFIEILRSGNETLDICIFTITCNRIAKAIENEFRSGVKVRIITDNNTAGSLGSDIESLARAGIPVKIDTSEGHMHHKFCVIDHKLVMNGSFNWTRGASTVNYENVMITNDPVFVKGFSQAFEVMWNDSVRFVNYL